MKRTFDYKIGIISDTHGLVSQRVIKSFKDVDLIGILDPVGGRTDGTLINIRMKKASFQSQKHTTIDFIQDSLFKSYFIYIDYSKLKFLFNI